MFAKPPVPYSTAFLAELLRAAIVRLARASLPEIGIIFCLLVLLVAPVLILPQLALSEQKQLIVEPHSHLLMEAFCGLTALTIAGMILAISVKRYNLSMILFGMAFLVMGVFDMLHAWTDPHDHEVGFVLFHTLSTILGSVLIFAGVVVHVVTVRKQGFCMTDLLTICASMVGVLLVAALYRYFIPELFPDNPSNHRFSTLIHTTHYLAGLLYALAAIAFYRYFRKRHKILALVVFSLLMVFAQSSNLFSFSALWDVTWWMWHSIKLLFYLGIMMSVFVGFVLALKTIETSRSSLAQLNSRLKSSKGALRNINRELKIRNHMVQEAMLSLDLYNTLSVVSNAIHQLIGLTSCELILRMPEDEVEEFDRRAHHLNRRWTVRAQRPAFTCNTEICHAMHASHGVFECGHRDEMGRLSLCLSLTANGQEVGRLRLRVTNPHIETPRLDGLQVLAVEVGAIVHNALLYHQSLDANDFRLALLRVSTMLTSTLELDRVLEAVCKESAALLESDGAMVWLPSGNDGAFQLASQCFAQTDLCASEELKAWCGDGKLCSTLLQGISGQYHPLAIVWNDPNQATPFSKPDTCPWEALAMFPLLDGEMLLGVMMLARKERVRFSAATLDKGELLAGQVRIAVNNARSYKQLNDFNQQLKLAEADKIRSERLAVMGQLSASVAHEVRNPLSAINNCLAVLRTESTANPRGQTALEIIQGEVERLTNLTNNFLSFGKPRPPVTKPIVLEQLVKKTCGLLERHISHEQLAIQVGVDIEPGSSLVLFDGDGLETVLWNLLLNASQAIPGPGRVDVALRLYPAHFMLVVKDSGKGITRESQARIFEPFYSQRSLGAGLGLAIVQRLVREWGGRIRLRSGADQGTAFILRVPAQIEGSIGRREVA